MRPNPSRASLFALGLLAVLLIGMQPHFAQASCGCGPHCMCGPSCNCGGGGGPPPTPPPQNPDANPVRKNQATMTAKEQQEFVDAVRQLQQTYRSGPQISIYDEYVHMHIQAMHSGMIHEGPAFFPWHRQYLRNFELELQAVNPNVTIPYWDFTVDNKQTSSIWSKTFMGGNGDPKDYYAVKTGPFRQGEWRPYYDGPEIRRNFGGWLGIELPTPDDLARAFLVPTYDVKPFDSSSPIDQSFRNYMTGWNHPGGEAQMHNRVHEWMGGSMMSVASPNDPVFWLMHAFLDKSWAEWMDIYGPDYPEYGALFGHNLRDPMPIFGTTPESLLNHHLLGYYYDTEGGPPAVPEPASLVLWGVAAAGLLGYGWRRRAA